MSQLFGPALCLLAVIFIALSTRRNSQNNFRATEPVDIAWLSTFSIRKYSAMAKLLHDPPSQGISQLLTPQLARSLRQKRTEVFREYLSALTSDLNKLRLLAQLLTAQSSADRSETAAHIRRLHRSISMTILSLHLSSMMFEIGFPPFTLAKAIGEVAGFSNSLRSLQDSLVQDAPLPDA